MAYLQLESEVLFVVPEGSGRRSLPAFRLAATKPPNFQGAGLDITVWPETLEWTMVFSHEEGEGPYLCRREWAVLDAD